MAGIPCRPSLRARPRFAYVGRGRPVLQRVGVGFQKETLLPELVDLAGEGVDVLAVASKAGLDAVGARFGPAGEVDPEAEGSREGGVRIQGRRCRDEPGASDGEVRKADSFRDG